MDKTGEAGECVSAANGITGCGMDFCTGLENLPAAWRGAVVTIGNFDGVHRGHRRLIERLREVSSQRSSPDGTATGNRPSTRPSTRRAALAVTFDPPPGTLLPGRGPAAAPLTDTAEKVRLLRAAGADGVVVLRTTAELLSLPPEAFFEQILAGGLGATAIVEGSDFRFGARRAGTVETLRRLSEPGPGRRPVAVHVVPPLRLDDDGREASEGDETGVPPVSSSRIRSRILAGDVATAARLLGRPYTLRGVVVHGEQRGRTLGYPTANLAGIATLLPPDGVYAARVPLGGDSGCGDDDNGNDSGEAGSWRPAAVALGPNATFGGAERKCEVHLPDFSGDLYGKTLCVELIAHIRGIRRFESVAELLAQMADDLHRIRAAAAELRVKS